VLKAENKILSREVEMEKKFFAVGIAVVVIALLGVGVFLGTQTPSLSPTSTPKASPTPTATPTEANVSYASNSVILAYSSVFEGEKWMRILDNSTVRCYSYHLYPSYKDIEIREGYVSKEEVDLLLQLFSNLTEYEEYVVKVSEGLVGADHIFEPLGSMKISCLPSNKTLKLSIRPLSFPRPETITPEAEEILAKIDKIYQKTQVVERIKETNPSDP